MLAAQRPRRDTDGAFSVCIFSEVLFKTTANNLSLLVTSAENHAVVGWARARSWRRTRRRTSVVSGDVFWQCCSGPVVRDALHRALVGVRRSRLGWGHVKRRYSILT